MNTIILGATRGMGRALARLMAERGDRLFLLGRNRDELDKTAHDIAARGGADTVAGTALCDLLSPDGFAEALATAETAFGRIEAVIVTAGTFATQEELEDDVDETRRLLDVDFARTVEFCEAARKRLLAGGGGILCVFSSVAGERGRKPVVLYGAAKAGLTRYLEGLDHKFHSRGLVTITVKPGFVRTGMTVGLDPPPFAGEPEQVARRVLRAIDDGMPVVYAPPIWRWVMLVIRNLPRVVMRRVSF
jgi:NAD(P)-dependent dehydrogenase (short-subunit alcohol dehydrogenase family)